jgi:hypothetical protein
MAHEDFFGHNPTRQQQQQQRKLAVTMGPEKNRSKHGELRSQKLCYAALIASINHKRGRYYYYHYYYYHTAL